jgi:proteasome lid subunit RPN8/RPN11
VTRGGAPLVLSSAVRRAVIGHARRDWPMECCGFLIGSRRAVCFAMPAINVAKSRTRYRIDDRAHVELRRVLRRVSPTLEIRGIYHSHPVGAAVPSETDLAEAFYPEWVHVIVGLGGRRASMRAYWIRGGRAFVVPLR